ncbi:MAG: hypothetical protein ABSB34_12495 [Candidatus Limnocylindrales bacterium]
MRRIGVVLAGVALFAAACSSSTLPPGAAPAATAPGGAGSSNAAPGATSGPVSGGGREFVTTLKVTGSVTQSVDFTETLALLPACSVLAQTGFGGTWSIPQSLTSSALVLSWNIKPYSGPGTFTKRAAFAGSVELDTTTDQFTPVAASVLSITVNPDGSGSATFSKLKDGLGGTVSGSETWTCS